MLLSQPGKYGLRAILHLAQHDSRPLRSMEIAEALHIPPHFLAKILRGLAQRGILCSTKGPGGGFQLAKSSGDIRLLEVVRAIEGDLFGEGCLLGQTECLGDAPCPLHARWGELRTEILRMFDETSLVDVLEGNPSPCVGA